MTAGLIVSCVLRPLCSGLAHLFHVTSASGYILWWSVDYVSICLAILATSLVSGRFAFYCLEPLQILFFTSIGGLLSSSMVAVLAVSSPVLRSASFALFVLFSNGVPFLYTLGIKLSPSSRYHAGADVPWRYINLWVRAPCPMPHAPPLASPLAAQPTAQPTAHPTRLSPRPRRRLGMPLLNYSPLTYYRPSPSAPSLSGSASSRLACRSGLCADGGVMSS